MKDQRPILLTTLALVVLLAKLYQLRRQGVSDKKLQKMHDLLIRNLAETGAIHRDLRRTRGTLNHLHQYVMPVQKG